MAKYLLKLYIKGSSSISQTAKEILTGICNSKPDEVIDLAIIDLEKNNKISETDRILVVPTLVVISPPPVRRIIADLTDKEKICSKLGFTK